MGLLDSLLGGGGRQTLEDFTSRHEKGMPIDDREAAQHYERIAGQLGQDDYREAARDSLARLSPEERQQLLGGVGGRAGEGGGGGGLLGSKIGKAALLGVAAMAARRFLGKPRL